MKKITVAFGLVAVLAMPAGAVAKPTPDQADKRAAKAECNTLRGSSKATRQAFRTVFRSFSACVRKTAVEEAVEERKARSNAAHECKAERETMGREAFAEEYGTNPNGRNAFGKCVSEKARENEAEMDEQDAEDALTFKNAAKECAAKRESMGVEAFRDEYGTNENKRNAFGKCVSEKVQESEDGETPESSS